MPAFPTLVRGHPAEANARSVSRRLSTNVVFSSCGDNDPRTVASVKHLEMFGQSGPGASPGQTLAKASETS